MSYFVWCGVILPNNEPFLQKEKSDFGSSQARALCQRTNWFSITFFIIFCNFHRSMVSSPGPPPPYLTPSLWHHPLRMSPSPTTLGCPSLSLGMGKQPSPWPQTWPPVSVPPVGISMGTPEMTWSFQMDVMPRVLEKWWTCGNPGILLDGE